MQRRFTLALKLKRTLLLCCCGALTLSVPAMAADPSVYTKADLMISCNGTDVANDTRAAKLFAKLLEERSGGAMTVRVFDNDQLSSNNQKKGLELAALGIVDFDVHSTSIMANLDQRMMISTLPWLFPDYQAAEDLFFGTGGEYLTNVLEPKGLTYLGAVHRWLKIVID